MVVRLCHQLSVSFSSVVNFSGFGTFSWCGFAQCHEQLAGLFLLSLFVSCWTDVQSVRFATKLTSCCVSFTCEYGPRCGRLSMFSHIRSERRLDTSATEHVQAQSVRRCQCFPMPFIGQLEEALGFGRQRFGARLGFVCDRCRRVVKCPSGVTR